MNSTPLVMALFEIVNARFLSDEKMTYRSFQVSANTKCTAGEPLFYAEMKAGVPETCAGISYTGGGASIEEAIADLAKRVIDDARDNREAVG